MSIRGLGTQIVDCVRVRELIDRHGEGFLCRVYTANEITYCRDRSRSTEFYTAVWAAKEAVLRSLGTTWQMGRDWTEIEVIPDSQTATLVGSIQALAVERGVAVVLVTMAHTRTVATATAIAMSS